METDTLAALIDRAQRREPAAFDALVEAYSPRLYGYFYRLVGSRDEAEDLLQETFVRLVRTLAGYQHDGRFDAWLFRIATNLVRDRVRRSRRAQAAGLAGDGDPQEGLARQADPATPEAGDGLAVQEQIDRMQRALEHLPEAERQVIMLRHFSQMSFREIAELMETPLGTALARAHRGLAKLRELMEGDEQRLT